MHTLLYESGSLFVIETHTHTQNCQNFNIKREQNKTNFNGRTKNGSDDDDDDANLSCQYASREHDTLGYIHQMARIVSFGTMCLCDSFILIEIKLHRCASIKFNANVCVCVCVVGIKLK